MPNESSAPNPMFSLPQPPVCNHIPAYNMAGTVIKDCQTCAGFAEGFEIGVYSMARALYSKQEWSKSVMLQVIAEATVAEQQ